LREGTEHTHRAALPELVWFLRLEPAGELDFVSRASVADSVAAAAAVVLAGGDFVKFGLAQQAGGCVTTAHPARVAPRMLMGVGWRR
jgi:hypothetical protein